MTENRMPLFHVVTNAISATRKVISLRIASTTNSIKVGIDIYQITEKTVALSVLNAMEGIVMMTIAIVAVGATLALVLLPALIAEAIREDVMIGIEMTTDAEILAGLPKEEATIEDID